jgi:hypothetical protein
MSKRTAIGIVIFLAVGAVAAFAFVHRCRHDFFFYANVYGSCELPEDKIRLAFRRLMDRELPEVVRKARGVWLGSRESRIFVRFDTDANGIACIERMFDSPQAKRETLEGKRLRGLIISGWTAFPSVSVWQEKTGVRMVDPNELGAGRRIEYYKGEEGWDVYIDDEHSRIYIHTGAYT